MFHEILRTIILPGTPVATAAKLLSHRFQHFGLPTDEPGFGEFLRE
jgi:hypothetical protein